MDLKENKYNHLLELGGSDYVIVDDQPDIRGWVVKNESGHTIGEVDDLLFNPESQRVRYIIVSVDNDLSNDDNRKILVPIGLADLYNEGQIVEGSLPATEVSSNSAVYDPREDGQVVIVPIDKQRLERLPNYYEGQVDPEVEMLVRHTFQGANDVGFIVGSPSYDFNAFYNHNHFDEDRFYERRRAVEGSPSSSESASTSRIRRRSIDDPGRDTLNPKNPY